MAIKTVWVRTCQECMKRNITKQPDLTDKKEKWRDLVCKFCKSEGLDFGSEMDYDESTNKWIEYEEDEDGNMVIKNAKP